MNQFSAMDHVYMKRALALSRKGEETVYPNPMVGAVMVKDNEIIGEGWHHGPGQPHAEVEALRACRISPVGGTMYVTLEPCNHWGRTPPCTKAIIDAGVTVVKFAAHDPNPRVTGGGEARLREAGIVVETGLEELAALELNRSFFYHCQTGRPWVILKTATSLDGKITSATGESRWITGPEARRMVHLLRARVGAVLVGSGTVLADDPELTARHRRSTRQPLAVLLDSRLRISMTARLLTVDPSRVVIFCNQNASTERERELVNLGVKVFRQPASQGIDLSDALQTLGGMGVQSLLVEGGAGIFTGFLEKDLVNEYYLFYAPFFVGGTTSRGVIAGEGLARLIDARRLNVRKVRRVGSDILIQAY